MTTLKELQAQRQELDAKIAEMSKQAHTDAVNSIRELVKEFELTTADIFSESHKNGKTKSSIKIPAKYRDPASGKEWTGRGKSPTWIAGKVKEDYLITPASAT